MNKEIILEAIKKHYGNINISDLTLNSIMDVVKEQNLKTKEEITDLFLEADALIKQDVIKNNPNLNLSKQKRARDFCNEVRLLALQYELPFFVLTDGASAINNNGCEAIKNVKAAHTKWELDHGLDPFEDWEK